MNWIQFPKDFTWGTATASYQIEGASDVDGKGKSVWDEFAHRKNTIKDKTTGDQACDHYHLYKEDVELMSQLKTDAYRFSIAWSRILPEGKGRTNQKGLDFYDKLVDELLKRNIQPFPTLFHWDLPYELQKSGGFSNPQISDWFSEYVAIVAGKLGDRVKYWITLNEPYIYSVLGHFTGEHAPGLKSIKAHFQVTHNLLVSHGKAVKTLRQISDDFKIGITNHFEPVYALAEIIGDKPLTKREIKAKEMGQSIFYRNYFDPVFLGSYPKNTRKWFRLFNPGIDIEEDLKIISQDLDFAGVNHYSRHLVKPSLTPIVHFKIIDPLGQKWSKPLTDMGWEIIPEVFYEGLCWLDRTYFKESKLPIYITENGVAVKDKVENGQVVDNDRIEYLKKYIFSLKKAMDNGVNIKGYFVWSLMDNFEWAEGLSKRFGLIYVDYDTQHRIIKESGKWYSRLCKEHGFILN